MSPFSPTAKSGATIAERHRPIALGLLAATAAFAQRGREYDVLITGAKGKVTLDASGLIVAPGFIDIHSHGRRGIFDTPTAANYLHEAVTTFIEGPDGSSPLPLAPFLDRVVKTPIPVNFATVVGQGTIRGTSHRTRQPQSHSRRDRKDERRSRARHARWRVRNIKYDRGGGDPKNVAIANCAFGHSLAGKNLAELTPRAASRPPSTTPPTP